MAARHPLRGVFVTGTDTGVGKTCVSAALLQLLLGQGRRAAGYKPVAAGLSRVDGEWLQEDVRLLWQSGTPGLDEAAVGPLQLEQACAPHIAAALQGRTIELPGLVESARLLQQWVDRLVVEGVGGFLVPLGPEGDSADLACALGLPVVLVVGLRLGCLNHALLTAEAVRHRGLHLAGWIGNVIDTSMLHPEENLATLRQELARRHDAPCLGVVPWLAHCTPARVAAHLDERAVLAAFELQDLHASIRP